MREIQKSSFSSISGGGLRDILGKSDPFKSSYLPSHVPSAQNTPHMTPYMTPQITPPPSSNTQCTGGGNGHGGSIYCSTDVYQGKHTTFGVNAGQTFPNPNPYAGGIIKHRFN